MDFTIEPYAGSHRDLDWSFREADDSEELLDGYIDLGRLWVARAPDGEVIGHLQAVPRDEDVWEVTPVNGYPPGIEVDGIPLLDQVWFERVL